MQDVANLSWSMALQGHYDGRLLDSLVAILTSKCTRFSPQGISNTLWGCATLYHRPGSPEMKTMLGAIGQALKQKGKLEAFTVQQLANLAWAMVVLEDYNQQLLNEVGAAVCKIATMRGKEWGFATKVLFFPK